MKKVLVLLMSLIAVNAIKFKPDVLQFDLQDISRCYNDIHSSLVSHIYWSDTVTFRIQSTKNRSQKYLKIEGKFSWDESTRIGTSYDSLYYANQNFYVVNANGKMEEIPGNTQLTYFDQREPGTSMEESYLSIKYFGAEEIMKNAQKEYSENQSYYDLVLPGNPAIFLMSVESGDFLEYTYWSGEDTTSVPEVDGGVLVLANKTGIVYDYKGSTTLILDPKKGFAITSFIDVLEGSVIPSSEIFGVRMSNVGFLALHNKTDIRMLSSGYWSTETVNPDRHVVTLYDLVEKVKIVEPTIRGVNIDIIKSTSLPTSGKFQLNGHVLVKHLNTVEGDERLDPECPFIIHFQVATSFFLLETIEETVKKLCTDDVKVWPMGMTNSGYDLNLNIQLVYGELENEP